MTLTQADLVRISIDESMALAGAIFACRSLPHLQAHSGRPTAVRLRRIADSVVAEMGFRRWLEAEGIPYHLVFADAGTLPDHPRITLGGRRVTVRARVVPDVDDGRLLQAPWPVPSRLLNSEVIGEQELLVFACLVGHGEGSSSDSSSPSGIAHWVALPTALPWSRPRQWRPLGRLSCSSQASDELQVEVGGQLADRRLQLAHLALKPGSTADLDHDFYSLLYLHASPRPTGPLVLRCAALLKSWVIPPQAWQDLRPKAATVVLAGWLTKAGCRRAVRTARRSLSVERLLPLAASALRPVEELLHRMRQG
ncbi:MAG TPA: hypothetical protein VJ123_10800 [Anaerolineales bacterium]|nr:hypothetical protein [Anaerolineales bacterium]